MLISGAQVDLCIIHVVACLRLRITSRNAGAFNCKWGRTFGNTLRSVEARLKILHSIIARTDERDDNVMCIWFIVPHWRQICPNFPLPLQFGKGHYMSNTIKKNNLNVASCMYCIDNDNVLLNCHNMEHYAIIDTIRCRMVVWILLNYFIPQTHLLLC